jgi:uncharacterized protein
MTVVVDTGAMIALIDAADRNHEAICGLYEEAPHRWVLPWAILPEVDYLLEHHLDSAAAAAFRADCAAGAFRIEWGNDADLSRAHAICTQYESLQIGLVDASVIAIAERLNAAAIATLDLRDFGAVTLPQGTRLLPRDTQNW